MNRRLHLVCLLLLLATFGVQAGAPVFAQQFVTQTLTTGTTQQAGPTPVSTRPVAGRILAATLPAPISRAATRTLTPTQQTAQVHAVTSLRRTRA